MRANKVVYPARNLVNDDNKGALRIHDCADGSFVPGALQVNTYAFNPVTGVFIRFSNTSANVELRTIRGNLKQRRHRRNRRCEGGLR